MSIEKDEKEEQEGELHNRLITGLVNWTNYDQWKTNKKNW